MSYELNTENIGQFRLGYFHESNGQTLNKIDGAGAFNADAAQHGKEYALAQVSRGWDYINCRYQFDFKKITLATEPPDGCNRFQIEVRQYMDKQLFRFNRRDELFLDPTPDQPKIRDYDGLRLTHELRVVDKTNGGCSTRLEFKPGTSDPAAMSNGSYRISLNTKLKKSGSPRSTSTATARNLPPTTNVPSMLASASNSASADHERGAA